MTTISADEQAFTQSRVNTITVQALVLHLCNAAIARVAADAEANKSSAHVKGTAPAAGIVSAALSSPSADILRALIVELEPEVRSSRFIGDFHLLYY